ncbi:DotU family type IV/VI secretion system protein [Buttiauxella sp.]|uniref:DotU family type IV/VI secretion system protein n=1 Tax=Buttiauxella sp. TaxID=1972222 RepID=UPI003C738AB0
MMSLLNGYLPVFRYVTAFFINPQEYPDYSEFREKCIALLQQALSASERHHESQECQDAYFAVVLWIDERVLRSRAGWVKEWRGNLLQSFYFDISVGGEAFFERLDETDKTNHSLRMVYLFCLLMGFHGKYTAQDVQQLQKRIEDERQCLPEAWRQWPNDALLVEQETGSGERNSAAAKSLRQRKGLLISLPVVIYLLIMSTGLGMFFG